MNVTTGIPFNDGTYILYVNGEYRGKDDIGYLMHDFNCTSPDEMHFPLMADRTRYLKEDPKGVSKMCKAMEDMRNHAKIDGVIMGLRSVNLSDNEIAAKLMELFHLDKDTSDEYLKRRTA